MKFLPQSRLYFMNMKIINIVKSLFEKVGTVWITVFCLIWSLGYESVTIIQDACAGGDDYMEEYNKTVNFK